MSPPLKCLIVDSDPVSRLQLRAQLDAHKEVQVLATVETVAAAIPFCLTLAPDLIFLDQALPQTEKFAALPPVVAPPLIVALATHEKAAIAALESHAIDYLLKPYSPQRLHRTITKLRIYVAGSAVLAAAKPRVGTMSVEAFKVEGRSAPLLVKLAHIVTIKAQGDYTQISLDYGAKHIVRRTIDAWIKLLNGTSFFRLDRSTIVNSAYVVSYRRTSRDHAFLRLKGLKEPVSIGRRAILRLDREYKARPPQFRAS